MPAFSAGEAALNLHVPGIACEHVLRIMREDSGVLCRLWGLALNVIGMKTPFGQAEETAIKAVPDVSLFDHARTLDNLHVFRLL